MSVQVLEALETTYPSANVPVNLTFTTPVLSTDVIVLVTMWKFGTGATYNLSGMGATWVTPAERLNLISDCLRFFVGTNPSSQTITYDQGRAGRLFALLVRGVVNPTVDVMSPLSDVIQTTTSTPANTPVYSDIVNGRDNQLIISAASLGSSSGTESWPASQTPSGWTTIGSTDSLYNVSYHIPTSSTSAAYQTSISTTVSTALNITNLVFGRLANELNVRTQYAESLTQQTDPPLKYSAQYTEALSQQTSPPLRYSANYVEVLTIQPLTSPFVGWGNPI